MSWTVDINCDLGEGAGHDEQIMPIISSCNIACGGHSGNKTSIKTALLLAKQHGVKAGAHPSFEDRENFGRVQLDWSRSRFRESVTNQIHIFQEVAHELGMKMHHIKMHGALYHTTAHDQNMAAWTVELLREQYPHCPIYALPDSLLQELCERQGQPFIAEAFADRAYHKDGSLVARNREGAVLEQVDAVAQQLKQMVQYRQVDTVDDTVLHLKVETFCIHGDNHALVLQLPQLIESLNKNNISIAKSR
ncbi:MAG: 5-oxoprolinase subunit PxpA [Nonlabens sp.]